MTSPSPSWPNFLSLCDCFLDTAAIGSMWWPRQILLNDSTNRASVGTSGTPSHEWSNRHLRSLSRYPTSFWFCSISSCCPQLWIHEPPSRIPVPPRCTHPSNARGTANIFPQHSWGQQGQAPLWSPRALRKKAHCLQRCPCGFSVLEQRAPEEKPTWWVSLHSFKIKKKIKTSNDVCLTILIQALN